MGKTTGISWCDSTFNPWLGCTKVAPECKNCYAETLVDKRFGRAKWGKGQPRRRTSANLWKQPLNWNKCFKCDECGRLSETVFPLGSICPFCEVGHLRRQRVFCLSLGDWLDEEVPIEWLVDLLYVVFITGNLDWLLLTKRSQSWRSRVEQAYALSFDKHGAYFFNWIRHWLEGDAPPNVWIGVSAGADQQAALDIPAVIHFLSCEPMLHALDFSDPAKVALLKRFDQIIFGGESGKHARAFKVDWLRMAMAFCRVHGVRVFVKQMGRNVVDRNDAGFEGDTPTSWPMDTATRDIDSGYQGAPVRVLLKDSHGGDIEEWPEDLRVRHFPKARAA